MWWVLPVLLAAVVAVVSGRPQHTPHHHPPARLLLHPQHTTLLSSSSSTPTQDLHGRVGEKQHRSSGSSGSSDDRARKEYLEEKEVKESTTIARIEPDVSVTNAADRLPPSLLYTGWSPELLAGRAGADGSGARRAVSGVAAPSVGVLESTLSVYAEIKGEILVRSDI